MQITSFSKNLASPKPCLLDIIVDRELRPWQKSNANLGLNNILFRVQIKSQNHYTHFSEGNMKEMSEFCETVKVSKLKRLWVYVQHFTLFGHCWFMRMLVIAAKCPRKWSEDFMTIIKWFSCLSFVCRPSKLSFSVKTHSRIVFSITCKPK